MVGSANGPGKRAGSNAGTAQADSTSWDRRWALPALVMCPRRVDPPEEYSEGTRPTKPISDAARPNRRQSHTSACRVSAPILVTPR